MVDNQVTYRWDEKTMRKIAVFSNMYPSEKHPTFGIFVKNQVDLLRSKGLDVEVTAIDDPSKGKVNAIRKYAFWFLKSLGYMLKNRKSISVTHAHYAFPTGYISLLGKKWLGLPYVVTVHGGDIDKMATKSERIASMTKEILQQASAVIVVGERLKRDVIEQFGVREELVHTMSMGVDTQIFKPLPKVDMRDELNISQTEKMILFVGNLIEAKGVLDLVDAYKVVHHAYPKTSLHLIGSDKDEQFMKTFAARVQMDDVHISHHAPLSQIEIAKWLSAADVFVLPSHHEGFGLVALEAMATGTPVVATNVGGLSYLLDNDAGILVEAKNSNSLADGIIQALNEGQTDRKPNMQCKVAQHTYDVIAKRLQTIYDSVAKGRKTDE